MRPWDDGSEDAWDQFAAFEQWFRGHRYAKDIEKLISTLDLVDLYSMFAEACDSMAKPYERYHEMAREICGGSK